MSLGTVQRKVRDIRVHKVNDAARVSRIDRFQYVAQHGGFDKAVPLQ